jgi:diguanylate cyclase (GGDEF)-like protein
MRVLVADDDSVTRLLLKVSLERWKYEVILAEDGTQALKALFEEDAPKIAILDWVMPGKDGIDICRELRKRGSGPYIYCLLLTSKADKEDLLKGLEAGADDYLVKPFDPLELKARLWSGQRILALQDGLVAARDGMLYQATHDALTGVWNRVAILNALQRELNRSLREENPLSVIMVDLDHFKQVNDRWGHQTGDDVLRDVTKRMESVLRPYDVLGRYGGEEFVVIVPGCDGNTALDLAERLRGAVNARPVLTSNGSLSITLSLGVSSLSKGLTSELLLQRADEALYAAKRAGRNRSQAA